MIVDDTSGEVVGRLSDYCHRVLGMPTPPPPASTDELWAALWLERVMRRVTGDPGWAPGWTVPADLHPAFDLGDSARDVEVAARQLTSEWTWAALRRAAVGGDGPVQGVGSATAEWFDTGSLARYLLSTLPTIDELTCDLALLLPAPLVDRIAGTLESWSLPAHREGER